MIEEFYIDAPWCVGPNRLDMSNIWESDKYVLKVAKKRVTTESSIYWVQTLLGREGFPLVCLHIAILSVKECLINYHDKMANVMQLGK